MPGVPAVFAAGLLLVACGSATEPATRPSPTDPAASLTPVPSPEGPSADDDPAANEPASAPYALHEWGLIDVFADGRFELAAGPGQPTTRPWTPTDRHPPVRIQVDRPQVRKPVIYAHLLENQEAVQFSLTVALTGGELFEHFPPAQTVEAGVRWADVAVSPGPCVGEVSYPGREDPPCQGIPDDYCEVAELSNYEAPDADCLTFGGQRLNHLFYRGAGSRPELPLRVEEDADGVLTVTSVGPVVPGSLVRVSATPNRSFSISAAPPAAGQTVVVPVATRQNRLREPAATNAFFEEPGRQGLTDGETAAFRRAWERELFGGGARRPHLRDALLYWMPMEGIDALAHLDLTPPPEVVRRVMLVRVELTAP